MGLKTVSLLSLDFRHKQWVVDMDCKTLVGFVPGFSLAGWGDEWKCVSLSSPFSKRKKYRGARLWEDPRWWFRPDMFWDLEFTYVQPFLLASALHRTCSIAVLWFYLLLIIANWLKCQGCFIKENWRSLVHGSIVWNHFWWNLVTNTNLGVEWLPSFLIDDCLSNLEFCYAENLPSFAMGLECKKLVFPNNLNSSSVVHCFLSNYVVSCGLLVL